MSDQTTQPSTLALLTATAILAATAGWMFGTGSKLGLFRDSSSSSRGKRSKKRQTDNHDIQLHVDSSEDELSKSIEEAEESSESADDIGELASFEGSNEDCKMMFVVRTDLGMTKGTPGATFSV